MRSPAPSLAGVEGAMLILRIRHFADDETSLSTRHERYLVNYFDLDVYARGAFFLQCGDNPLTALYGHLLGWHNANYQRIDVLLNDLKGVDLRKVLKYTCEEVHDQAVSGRCHHYVAIPPLDGLHYVVATAATTPPPVPSHSDITDAIANQWHGTRMQACYHNVSGLPVTNGCTLVVKKLDDDIQGMYVIRVVIATLSGY